MTDEQREGPVTLSIVSCQACDSLFLESPRRHTCPTCGGDAGLPFFTFEADDKGVRPLGVGVSTPPTPPVEEAPASPPPEAKPEGSVVTAEKKAPRSREKERAPALAAGSPREAPAGQRTTP